MRTVREHCQGALPSSGGLPSHGASQRSPAPSVRSLPAHIPPAIPLCIHDQTPGQGHWRHPTRGGQSLRKCVLWVIPTAAQSQRQITGAKISGSREHKKVRAMKGVLGLLALGLMCSLELGAAPAAQTQMCHVPRAALRCLRDPPCSRPVREGSGSGWLAHLSAPATALGPGLNEPARPAKSEGRVSLWRTVSGLQGRASGLLVPKLMKEQSVNWRPVDKGSTTLNSSCVSLGRLGPRTRLSIFEMSLPVTPCRRHKSPVHSPVLCNRTRNSGLGRHLRALLLALMPAATRRPLRHPWGGCASCASSGPVAPRTTDPCSS